MQRIEKLTLVFMKTLSLSVKNEGSIDINMLAILNQQCKLFFILRFYTVKPLAKSTVISERTRAAAIKKRSKYFSFILFLLKNKEFLY